LTGGRNGDEFKIETVSQIAERHHRFPRSPPRSQFRMHAALLRGCTAMISG